LLAGNTPQDPGCLRIETLDHSKILEANRDHLLHRSINDFLVWLMHDRSWNDIRMAGVSLLYMDTTYSKMSGIVIQYSP
jgi:hypothetical protein